jgi:Zn-dependent peptidase ImmA (M78 family)
MLFRDAGRVVIGINSTHAKTRQRFTIAHECGHLQLHAGKMYVDARVNFRDAVSGLAIDHEEIEANAFAAALLMPQDHVLTEIRKASKRHESHDVTVIVDELARAFVVSKQAMEIRLKNLGLIID